MLPAPVLEIVRTTSDPLAVTERRFGGMPVIVYVSEALGDFLGYEPQEIVGKGYEFWLACGIELDDWTEATAEVRTGQCFEKYIGARHKNGSRIPAHLTLLPFVSQESLDVVSILRPRSS